MRGAGKVTFQNPPTSPNTAPATKSWSSRFERKLPEVLPPIERRFEDNPSIIRGYPKIKSSSRTRRFGDLPGPILETILYCKIQHVALLLSPTMSRSAAPATQNQCHRRSASDMQRHFQCVEQSTDSWNLTKYCACHAKWMSSMICVTYETSFPMRGASKVTLQPHQILRLPRKMNVIDDLRGIWNVISNARSR